MIALRVLAATIDLNSAVEVGLVIGSSASTTPIGSATYCDRALGVLVDHADGALVLQVVVEELGGDVVLDHLVLEHAEAGLLERELGELDGGLEPGDDHRADDPVDLRLVGDRAERRGGGLGALDGGVPAGDRLGGRRCRRWRSCDDPPRAAGEREQFGAEGVGERLRVGDDAGVGEEARP